MAKIELNFLGDLEVVRDGEPLALPPSKKTRALLAYIALHDRAFRREHLCELLWEIPDDPRGSLRWSLSKLRRLVDDGDQLRIVADRTNVRFDPGGLVIDLLALKDLVAQGLDNATIEVQEQAAARFRGNFLEGLELSNFHDFHAWCVAQREEAIRTQTMLLGSLVKRLEHDPQRALPHARALVGADPYDESARAGLIGLLMELRYLEEAEQQYELGKRMLDEIGSESTGELLKAWRSSSGKRTESTTSEDLADDMRTPAKSAAAIEYVMPISSAVVGREPETARLGEIYRSVTSGGGAQVVLLVGEPGIGKTRLLELGSNFATNNGAYLLEASTFESETMRPFSLWIDALRRGHGDASALFADTDLANRDRLFGAVSDLIKTESEARPVMVLFDDLQWSDESSCAALHYVFRMNRQRPLMAILAARDAELRDNAAVQQALRGLRRDGMLHELKMTSLSEEALRQLIQERAPGVDDAQIAREADGNPLLAVELARAESAGERGGSLDELVMERLARFDLEGAEVMRWAAVLSPRIGVRALVQLTGLDANRVGEVMELAERQAMLRSADSGFRFSHDLIARSVYAEISPARRQVMHRRVAELAEEETSLDLEHAADLAHHAQQSGDPGLATRAMVSAGRLCLRFFANEDALVLARRGLQLAAQLTDSDHVCRRLELYDVMLVASPVYDWEAAAEEYVTLAERALDHGQLAHARLGYHMASTLRWDHGNWSGAQEQTLQAERVTRGAGETDHVIGMAETAKCLALLERDLGQADAMLMEAEALAVRAGVRYHALPLARGMLQFHNNALDEAEELFKEARTLCKSAGERVYEFQANEYLVMIDIERGRFEAAARRADDLVEIGDKLREGSEAPFARALQGLCRFAMEDDGSALDSALEELRLVDAKHRLAYALTRGALLDLERQRVDVAISRAAEALQNAEVLERATEMLLARAILCRAFGIQGAADEVAEQQVAMEALAEAAVAVWARSRAELLVNQPD